MAWSVKKKTGIKTCLAESQLGFFDQKIVKHFFFLSSRVRSSHVSFSLTFDSEIIAPYHS